MSSLLQNICRILRDQEDKGWVVSLYIPNENPIRGSVGFYANISTHKTRELALEKAKKITKKLDNNSVIVRVRPWKTLIEIDDDVFQDENSVVNTTDKFVESQEKKQKIEDNIKMQSQNEDIPDSEAYISRLIYLILVSQSKANEALKIQNQSNDEIRVKKQELDEIFKRKPDLRESWKSHIFSFLKQCGQESVYNDMVKTFNELYS